MEIMRINSEHKALGTVNFASFDLSQGADANRFTLRVEASQQLLRQGCYIDSPGTSYGGVVRDVKTERMGSVVYQICEGDTWGGILARRVIVPPPGLTHYMINGEAHAEIERLISYIGLGDVFVADPSTTDIVLSYDARFTVAFEALREALWQVGARLEFHYDYQKRRTVVSAVRHDPQRAYVSDTDDVSIAHMRPVNHLVCAGTGEMLDRIVLHLYADAEGNISTTQTLFGVDEIDEFYDATAADAATLEADGRQRLTEYQVFDSVEIRLPDETADVYALDDVVRGYDMLNEVMVSARITKKVLTIDEFGKTQMQYETNPVTLAKK